MQSKEIVVNLLQSKGVLGSSEWTRINFKRQVLPLDILLSLSFWNAVHLPFVITLLQLYPISTLHYVPSSLTNIILSMLIIPVLWANLNGIV